MSEVYTHKIELALVEEAFRDKYLKALWAYCVLRAKGANSGGYTYFQALPGLSERQTTRILKKAEQLGYLTLKNKKVKIKAIRKIIAEKEIISRACYEYTRFDIASYSEFKQNVFLARCSILCREQQKIARKLNYTKTGRKRRGRGLANGGPVKNNQVAVSVIANSLEMSKSTAHKLKHEAIKAEKLKVGIEWKDFSLGRKKDKKIMFLTKHEAMFLGSQGVVGIQKVVFNGKDMYAVRDTDTLWISRYYLSKRYKKPKLINNDINKKELLTYASPLMGDVVSEGCGFTNP